MQWADIQWKPTNRMLRQFSVGCLCFFPWMAWLTGQPLICAGMLIGLMGLWLPQAVRWIFVGWMVILFPIAWLVSKAILAVIYFGIFLPTGLLFWLIGRDALKLRIDSSLESYWEQRSEPTEVKRYFRQF